MRSFGWHMRTYWREIRRLGDNPDQGLRMSELLRLFPRWYGDLTRNRPPLEAGQPWLVYSATRYLQQKLSKGMRVFEFGCGGSTLFLASLVKDGLSVEHDADWAGKVRHALREHGHRNWEVCLVPPTASAEAGEDAPNTQSYASSGARYAGLSFRNYAAFIDRFPDGFFDVILVDGRARTACLEHVVPKVKRDEGIVILDNAERPRYASIHDRLAKEPWIRTDFWGPGPGAVRFWRTTVWQRVPETVAPVADAGASASSPKISAKVTV